MSKSARHPMQPLVMDGATIRFKRNKLVEFLLDHGGIDLNQLAAMQFTDEDRCQFAQLIGYSLSGFGELNYVNDRMWARAERLKVSEPSK